MGLYNFQSRFVPKILAGEKTHTIRAVRANPDKPGNVLHRDVVNVDFQSAAVEVWIVLRREVER
jgi:uncharacterized protein YqfB (UPF0267 family)